VPKNLAASVHQRLLNQARESGRPFDELLQYFAMERFLYRLSQSGYRDSFILKGALLFRIWADADTRATRDMDFLAFVDNSLEHLVVVFSRQRPSKFLMTASSLILIPLQRSESRKTLTTRVCASDSAHFLARPV
jgi:hypothetical protein